MATASNLPKSLGLKERQFGSLAEAEKAYNELIRKMDEIHRHLTTDITSIIKRLDDGGL